MSNKTKTCFKCEVLLDMETTYYLFGDNFDKFLCQECYNKIRLAQKIKKANIKETEVIA